MPLPDARPVRPWIRVFWCCAGFAGLTLLTDHQSLFTLSDHKTLYFASRALSWLDAIRLLLSLAVLTTLGVVVSLIWPRRLRDEGRAALLFVLTILVAMLVQKFVPAPYIFWVWFRIAALVGVALIYAFRRRWIEPMVSETLLLAVWILAANLFATAYRIHSQPELAAAPAPAQIGPHARTGGERLARTVVVILDEFDQRIGFEQRPNGFSLPALDRLKDESVTLTDARPAGAWTLDIIPAYLTGRPYRHAKAEGPSRLLLYPSPTGDEIVFDGKQTLFARLDEMGARSVVIGYYHPYCRILAGLPLDCQWYANADASDGLLGRTVFESKGFGVGLGVRLLSHHAWSSGLTPTIGLGLTGLAWQMRRQVASENQAAILDKAMRESLRAAADAERDFVFVHLPVPHPPGVGPLMRPWIRGPMTGVAYLDNMLVADGFVATLREKLVEAGLWESTNIIITSDHPLRRSVWKDRRDWIGDSAILGSGDRGRIPFYLKPAGGGAGSAISTPVPLLCMHDLMLALAKGEIKGMSAAGDWLKASSGRYPLKWQIRTPGGLLLF